MSGTQNRLLSEVLERYEQWRTNKKGNDKTPEELWVLARKLIGHYTRSQICKTLRINSTQYKRYILQQPVITPVKAKPSSFVEASFNPARAPLKANPSPSLMINRQDGVSMTLQNLAVEQIALLMNQFLVS